MAVCLAHLGDLAHHKLLLVSSHTGASLGVLVGPDQQLDQAGDGPLLTQRAVIGRAQGQVTDQTDGCLEVEEKGKKIWVDDYNSNMARGMRSWIKGQDC